LKASRRTSHYPGSQLLKSDQEAVSASRLNLRRWQPTMTSDNAEKSRPVQINVFLATVLLGLT